MRRTICNLTTTTLLMLAFLGIAEAQVAVHQAHFSVITLPSQVGQQVLLGSLPLASSTRLGLASFDFQAVGLFQGEWQVYHPVGTQESFDFFICDAADCEGSIRSQLGRVILVPTGTPRCLDGAVTLRGTFAQASGGLHDAIFTGMLEGLWTGKPHTNLAFCTDGGNWTEWADGLIEIDDPDQNTLVTGPIGALPTLSNPPSIQLALCSWY